MARQVDSKRVIKTFRMTAAWRELWLRRQESKQRMVQALEALKEAIERHERHRAMFWLTVEEDTGLTNNMRYNKQDDVIEVLEK